MGLINRKQVTNAAIQRALGAPIGIDFGTGSLKVLQLSGEETHSLVAAGSVDTPSSLLGNPRKRLDFQFESLPKLISALPLKGRRAVCSIPVPLTFCKHAQFPKQDGMPVEVLADTMLTEQLGRDASTLIRRLIEVPAHGHAGNKSEYICIATGREVVDRLMKALKASKLEIVGIHSEFEASLRAFTGVNRRTADQHSATLYLDIGTGNTQCFIGHGRELVFARTIDTGGFTLDTCLAADLACSVEQAHKARLAMGDLESRATREPAKAPAQVQTLHADEDDGGVLVAEERRAGEGADGEKLSTRNATPIVSPTSHALRETLEILTDEASMGIRYHDAMFPDSRVSEIVFIGGEARHRALCQHLAKAIRLPAKVADPFGKIEQTGNEKVVGFDPRSPQPGWTVPIGLCQSPTDL
jgi:Tfp pilus assembly PilM family ATPase